VSVAEVAIADSNYPIPRPWESGKPPQAEAENRRQQPQYDQTGSEELPFFIKEAPPEILQKQSEEAPTQESGNSSPEWWTVYLTAVLATIGVMQTIVFGLQAHRLKQTINTMKGLGSEQREIGEAQVRAYVSIKAATIEFMLDAIHPCVRFIAYNSGQSPARNFIWNITLQYAGAPANRESMLNEKWLEGTGIDIPAASDAPKDGALIPDMSVKQYIEGVAPGTLVAVIRARIDFRFTDVFDKDWFGETFFAGTMRRVRVSQEALKRGVIPWTSQIFPIAKPRDWNDVGKAKNTQNG
jgi:hypothetical protein